MLSHATPRQADERYNNRTSRTPSKQKQPATKTNKGVFADGVWHCDCKQRLPAERFQVKKEGRTKGKWFYTCQLSSRDPAAKRGCGFFLWQDDAQLREQAAVLGNSRSEPNTPVQKQGATGSRQVTFEDMAAERSFVGGKGSRVQHGVDDGDSDSSEEAFSSPLKAKSEGLNGSTKRTSRMAGLDGTAHDHTHAHAATAHSTTAPETPRKAPRMNAGYMTPADTVDAQRTSLMPTSYDEPLAPLHLVGKTVANQHLHTPDTPRMSSSLDATKPIPFPTTSIATPISARDMTTPINQISNPMDAAMTPHSNRHVDAAANPDTSNSALVKEVMAELVGVAIPPATEQKVKSVLSKFEVKARGVLLGRDATREALGKSKQQIEELQATIVSLRKELDAFKNAATHNKMQSHGEARRSTLGQTLRG